MNFGLLFREAEFFHNGRLSRILFVGAQRPR